MFIGFLLSIDTQVETWYSNVKKLMKVVEFIWYTVSSIEYWKEKKRKAQKWFYLSLLGYVIGLLLFLCISMADQRSGVVQKLAYWVLGSAFPSVIRRLSACILYLTSGSETDEGVAKDNVFARTENQARNSGSKAQYAIH